MNIRKLFDYSQPLVAAATLFAIAILISIWYVGQIVYKVTLANDTVEVTGSAKETVIADQGRLTINLTVNTGVTDQQNGVEIAERAVNSITTYFNNNDLKEFETPAGSVSETYFYPTNAAAVLTGYTISRSVVVRSQDIAKLTALANNPSPLAGDGYSVANGGLELTYSRLDEMRVKLLTEAIKDATARANAIASESGRSVGPLRNAVGGVVQVLPVGGVDISDYGSYDTSSVNKDVMVTTRATFSLE